MKLKEIIEETANSLIMTPSQTDLQILMEKWLDISRILKRIEVNLFPHSKIQQVPEADLEDLNVSTNLKKNLLDQLQKENVIKLRTDDRQIDMLDTHTFLEISSAARKLFTDMDEIARLFYPESFPKTTKLETKYVTTNNSPSTKDAPSTIVVSSKKGIYCKNDESRLYAIQSTSKRFELLRLISNGTRRGPVLANKIYEGDLRLLDKEIRKINDRIKKNLSINAELIVSYNSGGYGINSSDMIVQFEL